MRGSGDVMVMTQVSVTSLSIREYLLSLIYVSGLEKRAHFAQNAEI